MKVVIVPRSSFRPSTLLRAPRAKSSGRVPRSVLAVILLGFAVALPSAQTKTLPRVYVYTDQSVNDAVLKQREESVKDLRDVFAGRKKVLTVTDDEDKADVTVEVLERATMVPKVRIGV